MQGSYTSFENALKGGAKQAEGDGEVVIQGDISRGDFEGYLNRFRAEG
jgi:hypothetical protein